MKLYQLGNGIVIRKNNSGSTTSFLENPKGSEYRKFVEWLAEGNTPEEADPEPEVIETPTVEERLEMLESKVTAIKLATVEISATK